MSAGRESLRSAVQLALAALLAAGLLAGVHALTKSRIAESEAEARAAALAIVLSPDRYDNRPAEDAVTVLAPAWLGPDPALVRRARRDGELTAWVLDVVAPDGYGGPIQLLVGVDAGGRVTGVRVARHRETPGLGDDIERERSDWITGFEGRALGDPPAADWTVRRDGGDFDQFAGATITPRAVVHAVARALAFLERHGPALRGADAGTTLRFDDAPEVPPRP